ncbi:uncharacterized protein J3R85_010439 [Psidium guajava]|nr:uncharacterized protein J3R85_010439 [Psidium guajava]
MIQHCRDCDGELSSVEALTSSHANLMSSSCSSFSHLSFDVALLNHHHDLGPASAAEALAIKLHWSFSNSACSTMLCHSDLHSLHHKQPNKCTSLAAARYHHTFPLLLLRADDSRRRLSWRGRRRKLRAKKKLPKERADKKKNK